jgi:hypothetical protein
LSDPVFDAARSSREVVADEPGRRLLVLPAGRGAVVTPQGQPAGLWVEPDASLLASATPVPDGLVPVCWSGSLAQIDGGTLFDEHPTTWGPRGWAALERACAVFTGPVCLRPYARHVLSDVPGCKRLLSQEWGAQISLLIDPASMLTPAILRSPEATDHLRRIFEAAGEMDPSRVAGVIVSGAAIDEASGVRPVPLHDGVMPASVVLDLARTCLPPSTPWVVVGPDAGLT